MKAERGSGLPGWSRARRVGGGVLLALTVLFIGIVGLGNPMELLGNGGTLRLANVPMGEYGVSVFTDPTPVRPDSLDVSVLVLREGFDGVVEDLDVRVWVAQNTAETAAQAPREVRATREQADDPRYYAAKFGLGAEGVWTIEVAVRGDAGAGTATFDVTAREAGLLGHPLVIILLSLLPLAGAAWWVFREDDEEEGRSRAPSSPARSS